MSKISAGAKNPLTILIAPLDWGLGHATRCVPVIHELIKLGVTVIIAAEAAVKVVLKNEFPAVEIIPLKGYEINYSKTKAGFFSKLIMQSPKIIKAINYEHHWLTRFLKNNAIDAVISDNRFGLWTKTVPCVYITHQLNLHSPNFALTILGQKVHYSFINRYTECWVPDYEENGIAGKLSHPIHPPKTPLKYIGPLSRLKKKKSKKELDIFVALSGPEPQRTIFEKILAPQIKKSGLKSVFVRGLPSEIKNSYTDNDHFKMYNHLPSAQFNEMMQKAEMVICRSGYSSVMDLIVLGQKAILVPTPGQTEQEYLAAFLQDKKLFIAASQQDFSLSVQLEKAKKFNFQSAGDPQTNLKQVVKNLVERLRANRKIKGN